MPVGNHANLSPYLDVAAYHHYAHNCQNVYLFLISDDQRQPAQLARYRNPKEIEGKLTKIRPDVDYKKVSAALANNTGWISWKGILQILEELLRARLAFSEKKIVEQLVFYMRHKLGT